MTPDEILRILRDDPTTGIALLYNEMKAKKLKRDLRLLRQVNLAEDVVHQAFVNFYADLDRHLPRIVNGAGLMGWLWRQNWFSCMKMIEQEGRRATVVSGEETETLQGMIQHRGLASLFLRILNCLEQLVQQSHLLLSLKHLQGTQLEEVAQIMEGDRARWPKYHKLIIKAEKALERCLYRGGGDAMKKDDFQFLLCSALHTKSSLNAETACPDITPLLGKPLALAPASVQAHLSACPDCHETYLQSVGLSALAPAETAALARIDRRMQRTLRWFALQQLFEQRIAAAAAAVRSISAELRAAASRPLMLAPATERADLVTDDFQPPPEIFECNLSGIEPAFPLELHAAWARQENPPSRSLNVRGFKRHLIGRTVYLLSASAEQCQTEAACASPRAVVELLRAALDVLDPGSSVSAACARVVADGAVLKASVQADPDMAGKLGCALFSPDAADGFINSAHWLFLIVG